MNGLKLKIKLVMIIMAVFVLCFMSQKSYATEKTEVITAVPAVTETTTAKTETTETDTQQPASTETASTEVTSTEITLAKLNNAKAVLNKKKIKLTWDKVKGAAGYRIYRRASSDDDSDYKMITSVKKLTYTDKNISAGNLYEYYVVAIDGDKKVVSEPSDQVYTFIEPESFEVQSSFTKKKKIKLSWNKVPAAGKYVIYKKNSAGKFKKLAETKKAAYTDSKVKKGKSYQYKVSYVVNLPDGSKIEKKSTALSVYANAIDPNKKMVALTFDDGPGRYTQEIVDCLKKNDARATFYVLGCNVDSYKSALKNAYKAGCEIGNHSYSHAMLYNLSADGVAKEMADTDAKIKKVTGATTATMRCPGGGVNSTVQNSVGKPIILWSIDTLDWKTRNTDKTISAVMNNVKDGDIVLMHDIHEPTKRAALYIIPELKKKGYQLVTVSELAEYRGYKLKSGSIYHNLRKKK